MDENKPVAFSGDANNHRDGDTGQAETAGYIEDMLVALQKIAVANELAVLSDLIGTARLAAMDAKSRSH